MFETTWSDRLDGGKGDFADLLPGGAGADQIALGSGGVAGGGFRDDVFYPGTWLLGGEPVSIPLIARDDEIVVLVPPGNPDGLELSTKDSANGDDSTVILLGGEVIAVIDKSDAEFDESGLSLVLG